MADTTGPPQGANHMTYSESAEGITITKDRARIELRRHGVESEWPDFLRDMGDRDEYTASEVLAWLGY